MIIHDVVQRTPEWYAVKCGKIGASTMSNVLAKGRGNSPSKTRQTFMLNLLAERLSGIPQETYFNGAMQWGIDNEEFARNTYELETGNSVTQVGFVELNEFVGCSPDGFVDDDGLCEIKCPNTSTHLQYILDNRPVADYDTQVQTQLWVTDRKWCDFVSFDPRVPCRSFWTIRIKRNENKIKEIIEGTDLFIKELLELERKIKNGH